MSISVLCPTKEPPMRLGQYSRLVYLTMGSGQCLDSDRPGRCSKQNAEQSRQLYDEPVTFVRDQTQVLQCLLGSQDILTYKTLAAQCRDCPGKHQNKINFTVCTLTSLSLACNAYTSSPARARTPALHISFLDSSSQRTSMNPLNSARYAAALDGFGLVVSVI